jgi:hypothetical protein
MRVLDLGGTPASWQVGGLRPLHVTIMNLSDPSPASEPWISTVVGDACDPPADVMAEEFDLVYSNSVIEHVGGHEPRCRFASVVRRLAPHHWVQTPNRYFPIEPHWRFPGFQFLPVEARMAIAMRWPLSWYSLSGATPDARVSGVFEIELITPAQLAWYFPESEIVRERWCGMAKSIVAVR